MSSYREDNGNFEKFFDQLILLKTSLKKKPKIRWLIQTLYSESQIFPRNSRIIKDLE